MHAVLLKTAPISFSPVLAFHLTFRTALKALPPKSHRLSVPRRQHASFSVFGKDIITDRYEFRGDITLTVARQAVADVVRWLRDSAGFDMLVNLSSVDNMGESPRFEVNYTLTQSETGANLSLKTKVDDGEEVPSVTEIFQSANWHEREAWDLMGIKFSGHPDLRRILMWEGYPYFPLRKDFPVQGVPTELPGVAFTEAAPTQGAPFATEQGRCPSACREPRSHKF